MKASLKMLYFFTMAHLTTTLANNFYVDFDLSMGKDHPLLNTEYKKCQASTPDLALLNRFKAIYQKNNPAFCNQQETPRIPKIIHQIWLGSPVPAKFDRFIKSWKDAHPNWEYKLWTDTDIEQLNLENAYYYCAAVNYGERSDIARNEILYRFGGVYVDIDMECVKPLDSLHHRFDFYAGLEPLAEAPFLGTLVIASNALVGCIPGHPAIKNCIKQIPMYMHEKDIIKRTGPIFFSNAIIDFLESNNLVNIVLPCSYFFPAGKNVKTEQDMAQCVKPETYAIHHWAGSWMFDPKAFVPGYKFKIRVVQK